MQRAWVAFGWLLVVGSVIGWPWSAVTLAREEPPFILGLSWAAVILTGLDILKTSMVHRDQNDDTE
jgi:hypothetical protein